MSPIISIENLSKSYLVGHRSTREGYTALRDVIARQVKRSIRTGLDMLRGKELVAGDDIEEFWALRNVSFEVQPGEILGIIGRNGAGKSTLLKVLSRITEPTEGRITLRGRVASLLEVGTGFHPELTGRENISLNGAILGMSRSEIARKFDQIVDFAEVSKFLDTPVKRYSSGMYVRLAFSVAVHLHPEILVVDEVLAVGDSAFQAKCMRKMSSIAQSGMTVLVVSHNLSSIKSLCSSVVHLEQGKLIGFGETDEQLRSYLKRLEESSMLSVDTREDREGAQNVRLMDIHFVDEHGIIRTQFSCGELIRVLLKFKVSIETRLMDYIAISCWNSLGYKIFHIDTAQTAYPVELVGDTLQLECRIPRCSLPPGAYTWNVAAYADSHMQDHIYSAAQIDMLPGDFFVPGKTADPVGGLMLMQHEWCSH